MNLIKIKTGSGKLSWLPVLVWVLPLSGLLRADQKILFRSEQNLGVGNAPISFWLH